MGNNLRLDIAKHIFAFNHRNLEWDRTNECEQERYLEFADVLIKQVLSAQRERIL